MVPPTSTDNSNERVNVAAYIPGAKLPLEISPAPLYEPSSGEVLIENHAFAIQPLDSKMHNAGYGPAIKYPFILGMSVAGIVIKVGEGVEDLKEGDRVLADTSAYVSVDERQGTWQKYTICNTKTIAKIGTAEFERAVGLAFPLLTAVAALEVHLGIGKPGTASSEDKVLIWGAGGAVGTCAVQYAKSVGYTVVVTASPRDSARQKTIGSSEIVDYKAPDVVDQLTALGPFRHIFNATGDPASQAAISKILQPNGGSFASVLPPKDLPENVKGIYSAFSMTTQKEEFSEFTAWWYKEYFPSVVQGKEFEPPRFLKREGGLSVLQQSSTDVFEGKVREKIIIDPSEA